MWIERKESTSLQFKNTEEDGSTVLVYDRYEVKLPSPEPAYLAGTVCFNKTHVNIAV